MDTEKKIKKVVIAGGGTAGWMTAAALSKLIGKHLDIRLVESDAIGTVGVGEATIPTLHIFHQLLGLNEQEVMAATNATFKLGIKFENWRDVGKDYFHSFGTLGKDCWAAQFHHFWRKGLDRGIDFDIGDYCKEHLAAREGRFAVLPNQDRNHAYHLDATLYARFLRKFAEKNGVTRTEGKIAEVRLNHSDGFIEALQLESGELIEGELFIDCTGFRGLLIEQSLHTGYHDWTHWLPCDRAIAVQTEAVDRPVPYTRSIARESGWQWRIPLQSRVGNGLVYCSKYMDEEQARTQLLENVEGQLLSDPRVIPFRTGTRRKHWNKNCVAIGLSSGFIEPLESTSIHLIQRSVVRLMQLFPSRGICPADVDEFNAQTLNELEYIRDFIVLHYHVTERTDSKFWRYCRTMPIPDSLAHRLQMFRESGTLFNYEADLFGIASWIQVMLGQGLMPERHHPIVDLMGETELENFLASIRQQVRRQVENMPSHLDFIDHYCKANLD
ncbi:tryptophan halogenase [Microbulbifer donghaiensis]|uniref:Tryptophan halogenase n=1 Tax=Microbulbifer donghaiensis TaxID=494016 RepID=A0A1M5B632_9GAMM|nr:tryptophan halogenase family protein [Microbulbifer donghaiensis]SHF37642.1 tryptophan halogenase [Microbulbifer donghaiensis]